MEDKEITQINDKINTKRNTTKSDKIIIFAAAVVILFVYFFAERGVAKFNRDYYIIIDILSLNNQQISDIFDYSEILESPDIKINGVRYDKTKNDKFISVIFSGLMDENNFIDNNILFEYGDIMYDIRTESYALDMDNPIWVFGNSYVNIENPNISLTIYEENDEIYALYRSDEISNEIKSIINHGEKIYTE